MRTQSLFEADRLTLPDASVPVDAKRRTADGIATQTLLVR